MKKSIIISALVLVSLFWACNQEQLESVNESTEEVATSSVSTTIKSYVENNYPEATIVSAAQSTSDNSYIITLSTSEKVYFSSNGTFIKYTITSSDSTVVYTCDSSKVHRRDSLNNGKHGKHGKPGHGHGKPGHSKDSTVVSLDSLPALLSSYISTNFAGYSVAVYKESDSLGNFGLVQKVLLVKTDSVPVKLAFDLNGNYLAKYVRVNYSTVPTAVSTIISSNYSTYSVKKKSDQITLADGTIEYRIFLTINKTKKVLFIKEDGTVIFE